VKKPFNIETQTHETDGERICQATFGYENFLVVVTYVFIARSGLASTNITKVKSLT